VVALPSFKIPKIWRVETKSDVCLEVASFVEGRVIFIEGRGIFDALALLSIIWLLFSGEQNSVETTIWHSTNRGLSRARKSIRLHRSKLMKDLDIELLLQ
jgi:hypothetical protein